MLAVFVMALFLGSVSAENVTVSDGGLLAIEGDYSQELNETYYGHTLYVKMDNASDYDILIDGTKVGTDKATYTVKESSGDLVITTNPEANNITVNIEGHEGYTSYLVQYLVFCKDLPAILGNITIDLLMWAVFGLPIATAITLKIAFWVLRSVVFSGG